MEEMTNNQKKPNVFKRFGGWYKKKYEAHPVATITITAGIGTAVVGGVGYAVYKIATHNSAPVEEVAKIAASDSAALGEGIAECITENNAFSEFPCELGFDRVKAVNEAGEVIGNVIEYGDDWVGVLPVEKAAEAVEEVVETITEAI